MKRILKRVALVVGALILAAIATIGIYVLVQTSRFDASVSKIYDVPIPTLARSTDPLVIARGKHLAESIASCATRSCHGEDLGGGKVSKLGPVATLVPPNITSANLGAAYSDGELARLIRHGIKKDGRSVIVMPMQEIDWLPDDDVIAVISYVRSVPPVERPNGTTTVSALGKVFDRRGQAVFDIARAIDHEKPEHAPPRAATAEYGAYIVRLCQKCHGETYSGGPYPGAPASVLVPPNITPHGTGLAEWSYEDFDRLLSTGVRKNGKMADAVMPYDSLGKMDDLEKKALWLALRALPARPFGGR